MKNAGYILAVLLVLLPLSVLGQDGGFKPGGKIYDYVFKMPDFMAGDPETTSDTGTYLYWLSKDGKNRVTYSYLIQSRKVLATPTTLNKAVQHENIMVPFIAAPKFIDVGRSRYISEQKDGNKWEIAIAEETPDRKCRIAIFWINGADSERKRTLQRAIRLGGFAERSEAFDAIIKETFKRSNQLRHGSQGRLVINLHQGGEIFIEGKEIALSKVAQLSREWINRMKDEPYNNQYRPRLHLRVHKKCKAERIRAVVKSAEEGGLKDIVFGTFVSD